MPGAGRRISRGFTLIELMVALSILALLALASGTFFGDFLANSRLREEGNTLYTQFLIAQSEAINRNSEVQLVITAAQAQMVHVASATVLRTHVFNHGVEAAAGVTVRLGSDGRPFQFGQASAVNLIKSGVTCSAELRCPGVRMDGGGAVRLCANHQVNCS